MHILEDSAFKKTVKRLHPNQKHEVYQAIRAIMADPLIGIQKKATLSHVQVYKFHMANQRMLLGYVYESDSDTLNLLSLGSHENFYRDLKKEN